MIEENSLVTSQPKFIHRAGMLGFIVLEKFFSMLSFSLTKNLGRIMGLTFYMLSPSRRKIVARNLRIVINPALRGHELDELVKENLKRTGANMLLGFKTGTLSKEELAKHVSLPDKHVILDVLKKHHSTICIIPHSNNWEILARVRQLFPEVPRWASMYRQLDNPLLEQYIYAKRTEQGCDMFSKENGVRPVLKYVNQGCAMGVLSDQFTQEGLFLPYFGKVTGTTPLPALLRKRTGADFSGVRLSTEGKDAWTLHMHETVDTPYTEKSSIPELTLLTNQILEKIVSQSPLDCFWAHHRWKPTYHFCPSNEEVNALLHNCSLQPFRIIVSPPDTLDESIACSLLIRILKEQRKDMQISILCPQDQAQFWQTINEVSYVLIRSNDVHAMVSQMNTPEFYNDGPLDIAYVFDQSKAVTSALKIFAPVAVFGYDDHPCAKSARFSMKRSKKHIGPPLHHSERILDFLRPSRITYNKEKYVPTRKSVNSVTDDTVLISPFTTLNAGDYLTTEEWKELIASLDHSVRIIALSQHSSKATALAQELNTPLLTGDITELMSALTCVPALISVDGVIPALSAHTGTPTVTLFASRLPIQHAPLGDFHTCLYKHTALMPFPASATPKTFDAHINVSITKIVEATQSILHPTTP